MRLTGRHRAGPAARTSRTAAGSGRTRWAAGAAVTALFLGTMTAMAPPASAALSGVGPLDPASLFPSYYEDASGLRLQMCEDGPPLCLSGGPDPQDKIQAIHAAGGDAESFYFQGSADVAGFTVEMAVEAAYAADGADQEVVFQRRQATGKEVAPNGRFTITDPYGTYTCTSDSTGLVQPARGCRFETSLVPTNFTAALSGPIGPFLTWDTLGAATGAPPAGYIGDGVTPHTVVGSPNDFNKIRVTGTGVVGTCTNADGSTVSNCQETDEIAIQGKIQPGGAVGQLSTGTLDFGDVPGTPPVTRTLTYANLGDAPIAIDAPSLTGNGAAAYTVANRCPVAPATLPTGTRCTIDVTFTPDPGKNSPATLAITDDTGASPRNVALKGSNLPVMYVSDPAPPGGLAFGSVSVASTSIEDNAVIGNSGNGPMTVSTVAITGTGAGHFKLGPNTGCTGVTVAPDDGCEIGVQFAPTSTGGKSATLRVTDSTGKVVTVPLSGTATVQQVPGAPSGATATAGNGAAVVTWTAPTNTGTSAITGYSVRVLQGGVQVGTDRPATGTSLNVTGLDNGTTYTFRVAATNASGSGAFSGDSNAVTPRAAVPGAPTGVTATPGNAQATVRWTAPASNGGAPITGYTVRTFVAATGAAVGTPLTVGNVLTATVTGLSNGTAYVFDVAATNSTGTGAFSSRSAAVTSSAPDTQAPTAPVLSGSVTGTTANLSWTAATDNVGVTGYRVFRNGVQVGTTAAGTRTFSQTGLAAGTYAYTVRAADAATNVSVASNSLSLTVAAANPPPTLSARTPGVNARSVGVAANVTATFNEAVTGVGTGTFQLRNPAGTLIAGSVTRSTSTTTPNQWILNPTANLAADTRYTVTLTGGTTAIRDTAGAAFTTATWSFTTGPAPTVSARTPAVGAVGVSRTANVTATFNEAVQGVAGATFFLRTATGTTNITAVVSRNGTTNQWILNPSVTLAANTQYRVTLDGGTTLIRDAAGNPLVDVTWTFTTGAA